tara:strand:- start:124 stop:867 length:744 start_codon:yes stop_codon:yes gene_type:complete
MDANAGARAAARQRALEKDAVFKQKALQFWNKETTLARTLNRNVLGYSRDISDAYTRATKFQGRTRQAKQNLLAKYYKKKKVNEGGRSRRYGQAQYLDVLRQQSTLESRLNQTFGRDMAYMQTQAERKYLAANARGREALGIPAAYGAPVMMPPTNRLGGALQIAGTVASVVSAWPGSDIKLKENVEQVGVSPQGYKIYEFNYIGGDTRFRGAMAQDVVKKNPMAVGINQNHLTVDYEQIDIDMEVV